MGCLVGPFKCTHTERRALSPAASSQDEEPREVTFYELDGTTPMAIPEEKLGQGWLEVLKYVRELRDQVVEEDAD